jgi:hypothetical protein
MKRSIIVDIISSLFILLFVYTAVSKLSTIRMFQVVLHKSPLIGEFNVLLSWAVPITELLITALLFVPRTRRLGLAVSLALMSLFTLYLCYMLLFTPDLPCSCGGVLKTLTWNEHLLFNIFFIFLAVTGLWLGRRRPAAAARVTYSASQ